MSNQILPGGLKFGDGLGDFMTFTSQTDQASQSPPSQLETGSDDRRRDFHSADAISAEDAFLTHRSDF